MGGAHSPHPLDLTCGKHDLWDPSYHDEAKTHKSRAWPLLLNHARATTERSLVAFPAPGWFSSALGSCDGDCDCWPLCGGGRRGVVDFHDGSATRSPATPPPPSPPPPTPPPWCMSTPGSGNEPSLKKPTSCVRGVRCGWRGVEGRGGRGSRNQLEILRRKSCGFNSEVQRYGSTGIGLNLVV